MANTTIAAGPTFSLQHGHQVLGRVVITTLRQQQGHSLFFTPAVPTLRRRFCPSIGMYQVGQSSSDGTFNSVVCSSTVEGADKLSTDKSRVSRLVNRGCKLIGCGSAVPALKVSNDDLAKVVDTNDEWISVRTGIRNRKENLTDLAAEAARKALEMAEVDPNDVDLILLCSSTPEDLFGSAPQIQKALGCKNNPLAFDITAACSGFMLGLVSAACYIRGGGFKNVLVIGADALSRYVDWTDRGTCILFGDAAGAVVVQGGVKGSGLRLWGQPFELAAGGASIFHASQTCRLERASLGLVSVSQGFLMLLSVVVACDIGEDGLFGFDLHSDGEGQRHLNASIKENETDNAFGTNGSVIHFPPKGSSYSCIQMNGKEVFRFAVRVVPQSIEAALENAGLPRSKIDWLLLHQANQRIIDAVAARLEVPSEHVISNLANYGNTSAASIPLALDEAVRSGKVQAGHVIAAAGFGAGLTWGSAILRWG
ncbi:hypothetical protein RND71_017993 [Anisodus tanguticus]|uniref:Uncharacterized protein n=1 Tax=Anisodus tanguticus TaxID=243964 RepID=A0AAE1VBN1_9SOLA|nr:hypothetical protein RND71_017993 [Anisodus tanguticus]